MKHSKRALRLVLAMSLGGSPAFAVEMSGPIKGGIIPLSGQIPVSPVAAPVSMPGSGDLTTMPAAILPAQPIVPAPAAAETIAPQAQLRALAQAGGPGAGGDSQGASLRRAGTKAFDGAKSGGEETEEAQGDGAASESDIARPEEVKELWFAGAAVRKALRKSEIFGQIRPIKNAKGSRWYWENFKKGSPVRIQSGGTLFSTAVTEAKTKRIGALTRDDFEGIFSPQSMKGRSAAQLRVRLIAELMENHRRGLKYRPAGVLVLTKDSEVRVVKFRPFKDVRALPENGAEFAPALLARADVELPVELRSVHKYLPKAVLVDLRFLGERIPYPLLEDMTKLMKAGVYFVMLSDKRPVGPGSIEEQLTNGLGNQQRSAFGRYKMIYAGDDGNALTEFNGSFPKPMPSRRFEPGELDIMSFAAQSVGAEVLARRGTEFRVALPEKADADSFLAKLESQLKVLAVPEGGYQKSMGFAGGRTTIVLRPQALETAIPHLLEVLRDHQGLFINPSDLMVISKDDKLLNALDGAVKPSSVAPQLSGEGLLEMSLAALLGDYRVNRSGDFAASASKIGAFKKGRAGAGGDFYNIYMFMGHVMHSAFNWALWRYRNTGQMPGVEDVVNRADSNWMREDMNRVKSLLDEPGATMSDAKLSMEIRTRTMYGMLQELVARYPIFIGTELPNLHIFDRFKKGELVARDILRLIYDGVLARVTDKGLELMIIDFKTGQTPTNQTFDKDTQVQLYDLVARQMWDKLPVPYGGAGKLNKVSKVGLTFIYPSSMKEAQINEGSRIKFEKFLKGVMGRMRKALLPAPVEEKAKPRKAVGKASVKGPK